MISVIKAFLGIIGFCLFVMGAFEDPSGSAIRQAVAILHEILGVLIMILASVLKDDK